MNNSTVFIVNKGFHDYSPAEKFGELVYMSTNPNGISQFQASTMARLFEPYIENSSPNDYILVTSYTVMISVASAMFAAKHKKLNLLIYVPGENKYEVRRLAFNSTTKGDKDGRD